MKVAQLVESWAVYWAELMEFLMVVQKEHVVAVWTVDKLDGAKALKRVDWTGCQWVFRKDRS